MAAAVRLYFSISWSGVPLSPKLSCNGYHFRGQRLFASRQLGDAVVETTAINYRMVILPTLDKK